MGGRGRWPASPGRPWVWEPAWAVVCRLRRRGGDHYHAGEATTTTAAQTTTTAAPGTTLTTGVEAGREIKVGFVDPITGAIAGFGIPGKWCVERWSEAVKDGLVCGDGLNHPVSIELQDSQSDSNRAAQVAGDLITNGKADFVMAAASPDTVNPVADQSEALGCPCLTVDAPMEPLLLGRGGTSDKGFKWTWHLFWGFTEMEKVYWDTWNGTATNKKVAIMFPNDVDGNAYREYFSLRRSARRMASPRSTRGPSNQ